MASDSTQCSQGSRAVAGSSQQAEANSWLLPLRSQSSRNKDHCAQRDSGADKHAGRTRLPPLLQPRQNEKDPNQRMKSSASQPSFRDSPSRKGISSPPAWSEMDFHRAQPSLEKAEFILKRRSARNGSSGTRLEPLQHTALNRLAPLQHSAPQLQNLNMRSHDSFAAKEVYSRGTSVFGRNFAASSSAPSLAHSSAPSPAHSGVHSLGVVSNSTRPPD